MHINSKEISKHARFNLHSCKIEAQYLGSHCFIVACTLDVASKPLTLNHKPCSLPIAYDSMIVYTDPHTDALNTKSRLRIQTWVSVSSFNISMNDLRSNMKHKTRFSDDIEIVKTNTNTT